MTMKVSDMYSYLLQLKDAGFFNNYSKDHILLKALNHQDDVLAICLQNYVKMPVYNLDCSRFIAGQYQGNPLELISHIDDGLYQVDSDSFLINFSNRLEKLHQIFGRKFDDFIKHQMAAGKENYCEKAFFQALSEIHILAYIAIFSGSIDVDASLYEPHEGAKKTNPEAKFSFADASVLNVEVKTPAFDDFVFHSGYKGIVQPIVALNISKTHELKEFLQGKQIQFQYPSILKLKDFINSACAKFCEVDHHKQFNILAINYSDSPWRKRAIVEPIASLLNPTTGILHKEEIRSLLKISPNIKNISAFIIYQCTSDSILATDFRCNVHTTRIIYNPLCKNLNKYWLTEKLKLISETQFRPLGSIGIKPINMETELFNATDSLSLSHTDILKIESLIADLQKACF